MYGEQVDVGEPFLAEEHLRVVNVVVECYTEEKKQDGDVHSIVFERTIMMQDQVATFFIILDTFEVLRWLSVRFLESDLAP